jgi:tetratricopeptide (TPR) repeat protein
VWLGVARLAGEWDWAGAEREMKEAIALAPDLAPARRRYAALLSARGDDDRALAELAQARRIDPLCTAITGEAALIHYRARRYGEAAALWREGLRVREDSGGHEGLFHLYRQEGDLEAAAVEALRVMALVGVPETEVRKLGLRTPAQIAEAFVRGAVAHLDRPGSYALPDRLAILHATLGDHERALDQLEVAVSERSPPAPGRPSRSRVRLVAHRAAVPTDRDRRRDGAKRSIFMEREDRKRRRGGKRPERLRAEVPSFSRVGRRGKER